MIAYAGWLLGKEGLRHDLTLSAVPRGQFVPDDDYADNGSKEMRTSCRYGLPD